MKIFNAYTISGLFLLAQASVAGAQVPLPELAPLPVEMGGFAAIAAVGLVIGARAIKRRK